MIEAIELYRLAGEIGRSGGTAASQQSQFVSWRDGQFEYQVSPRKPGEIVPHLVRDFTNLYLMKAGGIIKVGMSRDPGRRLQSLRTGAANRLEVVNQFRLPKDGARGKEAECHRLLRDFRTSGEWFKVREVTAEAVIRHVLSGSPDLAGVHAILAYERAHSSTRECDNMHRLEMAVRANPTIPTRMMAAVLPRIFL